MRSRAVWDVNEGFETFPPNTKEYLFIDVEAPDFILTYALGHGKSSADFPRLGVTIEDFDNYQEGEHVFVVSFIMENDFPEKPTKNVRLSAPAYIDMVTGTPYHVLLLVNSKRKKRRRSKEPLLTDQV